MDIREEFLRLKEIPDFESKISEERVKATGDKLEVLQINVGRLCNLACKHCHVEAGPLRTEVMSREVMEACLKVYKEQNFSTIDITGGAPEMNPHFRWFVEEASKISSHVIVRTNLTIMLEEGYGDLPQFYADHKINVVCSLPYYRAKDADRMRGQGSFDGSIKVIKRLNEAGYGINPDLKLDMVYNPGGAFFPPAQDAIEKEYKAKLGAEFGIVFNNLYTITNNPIGRFGSFLIRSGNMKGYMNKLYSAFNGRTLTNMMCRSQLSVAWDGSLYDCDFNQAIGIQISTKESIFDLVGKKYKKRRICFDKHCYACTAGQGSSCGGSTEGE